MPERRRLPTDEESMGPEIRFDGRTAIVTGGGSGIGRAHACLLAARGANVVVNDVGWAGYSAQRADGTSRAEAVAAEIRAAGGSALGHPGDVTSDADADGLVEFALDQFGQVDIVVNNAGVSEQQRTPVQLLPNDELFDLFDVHVQGTLRVTRAAWRVMAAAGYGRVLTTGSASAFGLFQHEGGQFAGAYATVKSSLFALTRQLAGAGRDVGIHVNMVMPWGASPMAQEALGGTPFALWVQRYLPVDKVAAGVLWFLSEDCQVSGEFISSAGGRVARVTFAQSRGYFDPALVPEDVRDNWAAVRGDGGGTGTMGDAIEMTGQPREAAILYDLFGAP